MHNGRDSNNDETKTNLKKITKNPWSTMDQRGKGSFVTTAGVASEQASLQ